MDRLFGKTFLCFSEQWFVLIFTGWDIYSYAAFVRRKRIRIKDCVLFLETLWITWAIQGSFKVCDMTVHSMRGVWGNSILSIPLELERVHFMVRIFLFWSNCVQSIMSFKILNHLKWRGIVFDGWKMISYSMLVLGISLLLLF